MSRRPTPLVAEFPVSGREAGPYGITCGPDGALWFTLVHHGRIGRLTPDGGVTSYQLELASGGPSVITTGPDGAL
ncbi:virginiamycin B lyase, partial [Streptomyces sp. SID6137]|nr:virginiamycin B lyase [Streptomyces sp. SID6137]